MDLAGGGQSTSKSTCEVPAWTLIAFGDRSASSMSQERPAWTLTPEMIPFGTKSVTLSMIDLLTGTCRLTLVRIASTDLCLRPQEMFTFSEMLALVKSESSFGAYVCHRRPGGSTATSDLVAILPQQWNAPEGPGRKECQLTNRYTVSISSTIFSETTSCVAIFYEYQWKWVL